jgi:hypothetical protein
MSHHHLKVKDPDLIHPLKNVLLSLKITYRGSRISKAAAIYGIIGAITESGVSANQSKQEVTAGMYIAQLDQHDTFMALTSQQRSRRRGT